MRQILYLSRATRELSEQELVSILVRARWANTAHNITGALVYGNGQFLHVMEGEAEALQVLYTRLGQDSRHTDLVKLADKTIRQRSFAGWSMACQQLSNDQFVSLIDGSSSGELMWLPPSLDVTDAHQLQTVHSLVVAALSATGTTS